MSPWAVSGDSHISGIVSAPGAGALRTFQVEDGATVVTDRLALMAHDLDALLLHVLHERSHGEEKQNTLYR